MESKPSKKTTKRENQSEISLEEIKEKVIYEDPSKWSVECLQKCLLKLGQSMSGSKEILVKRIINLKNNPPVLAKLIQRRKSSFQFKSRLLVRNIPPPEASWTADASHYPKVTCVALFFFVCEQTIRQTDTCFLF